MILFLCNFLVVAVDIRDNDKQNYNQNYDMVIISPDFFSESLQPLIKHKNNVGINTYLKKTEDIFSEYQGRDKPEQIKYFIKNEIEKYNITYVLIIGSVEFVPMRETLIEHPSGNFDIITDLYYADIYSDNSTFSSWDTNKNNIFGEFYWDYNNCNSYFKDSIDLIPDVNVGRLPCNEKWELIVVLNKIIRYETSINDHEWFKKIILIGGDTFPESIGYEGEIVTDQISNIMEKKGFNSKKLWASKGNLNSIKINNEINKGAGFICYSGHGLPNGIITHNEDNEKIFYLTPYLLGLFNNNKFPISFFSSCLTAQLDYNKKILKYDIPCFAWAMLLNPIGGSICSIGSTRPASTNVTPKGIHWGSDLLCLFFFQAYDFGISISDMFTTAQKEYIYYCKTKWPNGIDPLAVEMFTLIGDPSLNIAGYPSPK